MPPFILRFRNKTELNVALLSVVFTLACSLLFKYGGFDVKTAALLIAIPLFFVAIANTELLIFSIVILLFSEANLSIYKLAVLSSIPFLASYFVTYKKNGQSVYFNPLVLPFCIYLLSIIPSLINSSNVYLSLLYLFNLVSIAVTAYFTGAYIKEYKPIKRIAFLYILLSVANGIHVLCEAYLTDARVFGFAGIVYVDFVCVAILIVVVRVLYYRKRFLIPHLFLFCVLLMSLLETQTRNTMLSLAATLCVMVGYLLYNADVFAVNRRKIVVGLCLVAVIALGGIVFAVSTMPQALGRFSELFVKEQIQISGADDFGKSSMVTRLLIWYTAGNAFLEHPIIGIGAYSFPFMSQEYNTLPNVLYELFVEKLSPHVTYLAVLTETGIIGLIGFVVFLFSTIKTANQSVRMASTKKQRYYSLGILTLQVYVIFSMVMTDAWLWGRCGMLWALILGVSLANYNIVKKDSRAFEDRQ